MVGRLNAETAGYPAKRSFTAKKPRIPRWIRGFCARRQRPPSLLFSICVCGTPFHPMRKGSQPARAGSGVCRVRSGAGPGARRVPERGLCRKPLVYARRSAAISSSPCSMSRAGSSPSLRITRLGESVACGAEQHRGENRAVKQNLPFELYHENSPSFVRAPVWSAFYLIDVKRRRFVSYI